MRRLSYCLLIFLFIGTSCTSQSGANKLANTYWVTDILVEKETNELTPNLVLSFSDSIASIHQFGIGQKLFELPYEIKENKLLLNKQSNPFMKFLEIKEEEIKAALFPGDTTRFRRIRPSSTKEELIRSEIVNSSFVITDNKEGEQKIIYFDDKEVFQFSKDMMKDELAFPQLNFKRVPYYLDFTNSIPSIIIGNPLTPKVQYSSNGELKLTNLIIGKIDLNENNDLEINSFKSIGTNKYTITKIQRKIDSSRLFSGEWKRGNQNKLVFSFKPSGKVEISENGIKRVLSWRYDNSGYLIIITEDSGEKLYAIKNFKLSNKRIGLEFSKGKFTDLINLKK